MKSYINSAVHERGLHINPIIIILIFVLAKKVRFTMKIGEIFFQKKENRKNNKKQKQKTKIKKQKPKKQKNKKNKNQKNQKNQKTKTKKIKNRIRLSRTIGFFGFGEHLIN